MLDIDGVCLTSEDKSLLLHPEVGGLILFSRNIEHIKQVQELTHAIHRIRPDLLLAVDQEGGRVQRLRDGFIALPAMAEFSDKNNAVALAECCGWLMATEVIAAGFDFSFAPVLDLDYKRSDVIGSRSFSGSSDQVITLAGAFIQGMNQAGMSATGKHFPGHGWAEADSHVSLPIDDRTLSQIKAQDMQPFIQLKQKLSAVMPAHIIYSNVDSLPAGFSSKWIHEILRKEIQFDGVIFSDDLSMAGAHVVGDMSQRVEAAFAAGCDMALVCNDRGAAEQALIKSQQLSLKPAVELLTTMKRKKKIVASYNESVAWHNAIRVLQQARLIS
ncbi:UNVERIFIED_CONTAM: hypothetical protein GTU68_005049 [Idotea baltica]|nr:hypothetical protein [Idotea baltica]